MIDQYGYCNIRLPRETISQGYSASKDYWQMEKRPASYRIELRNSFDISSSDHDFQEFQEEFYSSITLELEIGKQNRGDKQLQNAAQLINDFMHEKAKDYHFLQSYRPEFICYLKGNRLIHVYELESDAKKFSFFLMETEKGLKQSTVCITIDEIKERIRNSGELHLSQFAQLQTYPSVRVFHYIDGERRRLTSSNSIMRGDEFEALEIRSNFSSIHSIFYSLCPHSGDLKDIQKRFI